MKKSVLLFLLIAVLPLAALAGKDDDDADAPQGTQPEGVDFDPRGFMKVEGAENMTDEEVLKFQRDQYKKYQQESFNAWQRQEYERWEKHRFFNYQLQKFQQEQQQHALKMQKEHDEFLKEADGQMRLEQKKHQAWVAQLLRGDGEGRDANEELNEL